MNGPRYGVKLMVLTELEVGGAEKTGGKVVKIDTPQEVSFDPQITEGSKQELRGGDRLLATVKEQDLLTGINATFKDAVLNYEAMEIIGGGKAITTGVEPDITVTGYEPPTLVEQAAARAPFKVDVYVSEYAAGTHTEGDIAGYTKITLWNCAGKIPTFAAQGKAFMVPSYTIKSEDNDAQEKPCFTMDHAEALPA